MDDFAKRLKMLRGRRSREEFARLVGIHPRSLINYEMGERLPKIDTIELICAKTRVTSDWLLFGKGYPMFEEGTQALFLEDAAQRGMAGHPSKSLPPPRQRGSEDPGRRENPASGLYGSQAAMMLHKEIEQLYQEIARLFTDKREMARERRELLLALDDKTALIEHQNKTIERLREELAQRKNEQ